MRACVACCRSDAIVATVTHADGRHLERLEIDRAAWVAAPAPAAEYAQRPAGPEAHVCRLDPTRAAEPYSPARDLLADRLVAGVREGGGAGSPSRASRRERGGRHRQARMAGERRRTDPKAGRSDPRAMSIADSSCACCSDRSRRPGGSSSASNPKPASCCASSASGPRPSASCFPGTTLRRRTFFSASVQIEDRHRENRGRRGAVSAARSDPAGTDTRGGGLGLSFGNAQAGLRSISAQDGVRMSASVDYLQATAEIGGAPAGKWRHPSIDRFLHGRRPDGRCWPRRRA